MEEVFGEPEGLFQGKQAPTSPPGGGAVSRAICYYIMLGHGPVHFFQCVKEDAGTLPDCEKVNHYTVKSLYCEKHYCT